MQEFENEVLIYDLKINKAFCLNQTSALVYQLADGNKTVSEISELMSLKFKTKVSEDLVWFAINELKKENLLENADEVFNHFAGLSRREVIRKIGLASMIALPIISSVISPTAVAAGSVCSTLNVCFSAATPVCQACTGLIQIDLFLSTDGTCTGAAGSVPVNCSGGPFGIGNDYKVTSV